MTEPTTTIIRAHCLSCGHVEHDPTGLELWNGYGACPGTAHDHTAGDAARWWTVEPDGTLVVALVANPSDAAQVHHVELRVPLDALAGVVAHVEEAREYAAGTQRAAGIAVQALAPLADAERNALALDEHASQTVTQARHAALSAVRDAGAARDAAHRAAQTFRAPRTP